MRIQGTLFFIDIDGTVADAKDRFAKAGPEPLSRGPLYTKWLRKVQNAKVLSEDYPVNGMKHMVQSLWPNVIFLTSRSEAYREVTEKWLNDYGFRPLPEVLMRSIKNQQTAAEVKEAHIDDVLSNYFIKPNVVVVDDDYNGELQAVCKKRGWTFLKAMSGGFF